MGRLAGYTSREIIRRLKRLGFELDRHGSEHDIYVRPGQPGIAPVPRHPGDVKEWTLKGLLRRAGVSEAEFLSA